MGNGGRSGDREPHHQPRYFVGQESRHYARLIQAQQAGCFNPHTDCLRVRVHKSSRLRNDRGALFSPPVLPSNRNSISLFEPNASGSRWIPNCLVTDAAWRGPNVDLFSGKANLEVDCLHKRAEVLVGCHGQPNLVKPSDGLLSYR